jgi:hypothetical protein
VTLGGVRTTLGESSTSMVVRMRPAMASRTASGGGRPFCAASVNATCTHTRRRLTAQRVSFITTAHHREGDTVREAVRETQRETQ